MSLSHLDARTTSQFCSSRGISLCTALRPAPLFLGPRLLMIGMTNNALYRGHEQRPFYSVVRGRRCPIDPMIAGNWRLEVCLLTVGRVTVLAWGALRSGRGYFSRGRVLPDKIAVRSMWLTYNDWVLDLPLIRRRSAHSPLILLVGLKGRGLRGILGASVAG